VPEVKQQMMKKFINEKVMSISSLVTNSGKFFRYIRNDDVRRIPELLLGLIGGCLGLVASLIALFLEFLNSPALLDSSDKALMMMLLSGKGLAILSGISALTASGVAFIGAIIVFFKPKAGGVILLLSALWGLLAIPLFYLTGAILIAIAGLMGIFRKIDDQSSSM
jgi:hypothetical protein